MRKMITGFVILLLMSQFSLGQSEIRLFKDVKIEGNNKETSFYLMGLKDKSEIKNLQVTLLKDDKISYAKIYPDLKCHLIFDFEVDADYVYNIISQYGIDYDYNYVKKYIDFSEKKNIQYQEKRNDKILPADFPQKVNTGNPASDEKDYFERIEKWKKEHPEEWQEMLKNR